MMYRIRHVTEYQYNTPVTLCYNIAHVLPRDTPMQLCQATSIHVHPSPVYQQKRTDYFGNHTYYFSLQEPHKKLVIDVTSEIKIESIRPSLDLDLGVTCGQAREILRQSKDPEILENKEFMLDSPMIKSSASLKVYAAELFTDNRPLLSAARELTTKIFKEFKYDPASTTVATPLHEVLELKSGVCQDFAHLAIGCLRSMGFPARYVSGYLETLPPPGKEKLVGSDATHAWFAIYSPGEGWFEFDPTNDNMPGEQHIVTAWGRDYSDVTPLRGVIFEGGGDQILSVSVDVQRIGA